MKNNINIDSILETKASGCLNVQDDLNQQQGKSIAQLIYEQTQKEPKSA